MTSSVLISFENRSVEFILDSLSYSEVKKKFVEFAENDLALSRRMNRHEPLFYAHNPKFDTDGELCESSIIKDGEKIRVQFVAIQDSDESENNDSDSDKENHPNVSDEQLCVIGISREKWDRLPKLLKVRELSCLEQHKLMVSMGLAKTPYVTSLKVPTTNKGNSKSETSKKTTPKEKVLGETPERRTSKRLKDKEISTEFHIFDDIDAEQEQADDPPVGTEINSLADDRDETEVENQQQTTSNKSALLRPPLASSSTQKSKNPRRKPLGKITKNTDVPVFSPALKRILRKRGLSKTEKQLLVTEVKEHLLHVHGSTLLTPTEWEVVSDGIVKEYPTLEDTDAKGKSLELRHSLQTSLSARRYRANKKERDNVAAGSTAAVDESDQAAASSSSNATYDTSLIDELKTKNPFENHSFSRLKFLIKTTLPQRTALTKSQIEDVLREFPHYKNVTLAIYEHSLMEKKTIDFLNENAVKLICKLKDHFQISGNIIDEEVQAIINLQDKLLPKKFVQNSKIIPAIGAFDESEKQRELTFLGTDAILHAPWASIIIGNNKDGERVLKKCFIQMLNDNFRSEITLPTLPDVLIGLLSFYFIFDIKYPEAYVSLMRFLERYVHGELSSFSKKQKGKVEYRDFMAKFE